MGLLNPDQFLPGMDDMREALPHEQTESQFMNRPDVFVHGRYVRPDSQEPLSANPQMGFHAGTEKASHDRLGPNGIGVPHAGYVPRFFHGHVDDREMNNSNVDLYDADGSPAVAKAKREDMGPKDSQDWGRVVDQGMDWSPADHGRYYRNDWEDKGSTSVVLPTTPDTVNLSVGGRTLFNTPENFHSWRDTVGNALASGQPVPKHVEGLYRDTGGANGPQSVLHPEFETPQPKPLRRRGASNAADIDHKYLARDSQVPGVVSL